MDLPYSILLGEDSMLAVTLRANWLKPDRSGRPLLLPPAIRAIDRLRAVFTAQETLRPGFIISLREGMGLTQFEFGQKLGVSKMTVSRWECGRMRPGPTTATAIRRLQKDTQRKGVRIDTGKRATQAFGLADFKL